MKYIITLRKYFPVTNLIRNIMQEKLGKRILISRNRNIIERNGKIILNVGTTYRYKDLYLNPNVINVPEICLISGNKLKTYSTVKDYVNSVEIRYGVPDKYPVIKRNDINSFHGKGIKFIKNRDGFGNPGFYSPYIPFDSEYRILIVVFNNEIKLMRFFRKDLFPEYENLEFIPKNAEHCKYYRISNPKLSKLDDFLEGIINAYNKFKNYYFGLDVGRLGSELFLIETNSAPGMNSVSAELFVNTIIPYLREQ